MIGITTPQSGFDGNDAVIAGAAAKGVGAAIATANIDDFPMAGITVEHWPIGS